MEGRSRLPFLIILSKEFKEGGKKKKGKIIKELIGASFYLLQTN